MLRKIIVATAFAIYTSQYALAVTVDTDGITSAMIEYKRDVIAQLASATDAESIFAAAIISDYFSPSPPLMSHEALLRRAQVAAPDDPHLWWSRALARACMRSPDDSAIAHLLEIAPQNAAVWLLDLDRAQKTGNTIAAQLAIARAAHSHYFDDYTAAINARLLRTVEYIHVSAAAPENFYGPGIVADQKSQRRYVSFWGGSAGLPYEAFDKYCAPERVAADAQLRADCMAVGKLLVDHSTTWLAIGVGLALQRSVAENPMDIAELERQRRNLEWQQTSASQRIYDAEREYRWMLEGRTELESAHIALKQAGIPLEPPADWKSAH